MTARSARSPRRRAALIAAAIVAGFLVVYGTVVALYAANDRAVTVSGCTDEAPPDVVRYSLVPQSVDAVGDRIPATLTVDSFGPLDDGDGLATEPVTVIVTDTDGAPAHDIAAGEIPSPLALRFLSDGQVERWPFDTHTVDFVVITLAGDPGRPLPTLLCGSVHVPGWTFSSAELPGTDEVVVDGAPATQVRIVASRSASTIAFGLVILALLVTLPVLALMVAVSAFRGRRKVEATLTSWMAAMLFATVPLRTFLPGSPPIGSWVDYLVVLWVVAGLVAALVIHVAAWRRWSADGPRPAPAPLEAPADPPGEPGPVDPPGP